MPPIVDLRSDTVTRPTPGMRQAIAEAEVGDMVLGDDPTVSELEETMAGLLGKERALFFPSGVMANQTAVLVQASPGTEAVIDAGGHILNYEEAAAAAWGGVQLRAVQTADGLLDPESVAAAIRPRTPYVVQTSLLCLENTHNSAGGRVLPVERMREVVEVARERGVAVHLDGARLPNASVAAGRPMREWAELADTVMVAFSKGLGAPVGSVLAGTEETMEEAWRVRRRFGGGMRQAGILAAAALYGLEHHFAGLAEDHRRAKRLAELAGEVAGVVAAPPETNIVMIDLREAEPLDVLRGLRARGVWMTQFGPRRLRAVTHRDVDDEGVERAGVALAEVLGRAEMAGAGRS
ncbi:MAG TPA: GntG family PLP-dependent aldolase [Longimicrobiaceae bacterium]